MNPSRFDRLIRTLGSATDRRTLLHGAAALTAAVVGRAVLPDAAAAKTLCRKNGSKCKKKGKRCRAEFCLKTPFTIEARWSNPNSDHDTYLFVPTKAGSTFPNPHISSTCNPAGSDCEDEVYPFICVSQDAPGPGDEITTVRRLVDGKYEYWIELAAPSQPGDLEVIVRNGSGRVVRSWSSPANPDPQMKIGWHVFDIDGARRSIISVDAVINASLPHGPHGPAHDLCD